MRERRVNRQAYTKPYTTSSQTRGVPSVSSPMVVQGCTSTVWLAMEAGSCGAGEGMCTKDGRKQHNQSKRPNTKCACGGATAFPQLSPQRSTPRAACHAWLHQWEQSCCADPTGMRTERSEACASFAARLWLKVESHVASKHTAHHNHAHKILGRAEHAVDSWCMF